MWSLRAPRLVAPKLFSDGGRRRRAPPLVPPLAPQSIGRRRRLNRATHRPPRRSCVWHQPPELRALQKPPRVTQPNLTLSAPLPILRAVTHSPPSLHPFPAHSRVTISSALRLDWVAGSGGLRPCRRLSKRGSCLHGGAVTANSRRGGSARDTTGTLDFASPPGAGVHLISPRACSSWIEQSLFRPGFGCCRSG